MKRYFVRLGKDVIAYGVMGGISSLIGVILLPIFTRVFETDEYGILEIVVTLTTLTAIFILWGVVSAAKAAVKTPEHTIRAIIRILFIFLMWHSIELAAASIMRALFMSPPSVHRTLTRIQQISR